MSGALEEMGAFFDARCRVYDAVHTGGIDGGMESKRVPATLLPEGTRTLLDLGVGTGLELEAVFARFPTVRVTGLDIAPRMLALLREKYPGRGLDLRLASYLDWDFGRARYDAALSVMTLHHYTHAVKLGIYQRLRDCLRPEGVYVECDYMIPEQAFADPQAEEDRLFAEYARLRREQGLEDGREYHFDTPCTVANQKRLLREAGFAAVEECWRQGSTVVLRAGL